MANIYLATAFITTAAGAMNIPYVVFGARPLNIAALVFCWLIAAGEFTAWVHS